MQATPGKGVAAARDGNAEPLDPNGRSYPDTTPLAVERGKRYRIAFSNMSMMDHPMHLHGHVFELASVDGVPTRGVRKDTIAVRPMMGVPRSTLSPTTRRRSSFTVTTSYTWMAA